MQGVETDAAAACIVDRDRKQMVQVDQHGQHQNDICGAPAVAITREHEQRWNDEMERNVQHGGGVVVERRWRSAGIVVIVREQSFPSASIAFFCCFGRLLLGTARRSGTASARLQYCVNRTQYCSHANGLSRWRRPCEVHFYRNCLEALPCPAHSTAFVLSI